MGENTPLLPGLSAVSGKCVEARFDGGNLSSDGGVLALREIDIRLKVAEGLAGCIADTRQPELVRHSLADIITEQPLRTTASVTTPVHNSG